MTLEEKIRQMMAAQTVSEGLPAQGIEGQGDSQTASFTKLDHTNLGAQAAAPVGAGNGRPADQAGRDEPGAQGSSQKASSEDEGELDAAKKIAAQAKKDGGRPADKSGGDSAPVPQGSSQAAPAAQEIRFEDEMKAKLQATIEEKRGDWEPEKESKEPKGLSNEETDKIGKDTKKAIDKVSDGFAKANKKNESVAALFASDESLSEDFKEKASGLFEALVTASVNEQVSELIEGLVASSAALVQEEVEKQTKTLEEQVDKFLNYAVGEYMKENQLAIERGIRTEIAESFIKGLQGLFTEHYISAPEEKYDALEEAMNRIAELEATLEESIGTGVALTAQVSDLQREQAIASMSEGLTAVQKEKLKTLVEGIEFDETFTDKVNVIKESHFKGGKVIEESVASPEAATQTLSEDVSRYAAAISRMNKTAKTKTNQFAK